eukprot:5823277-Amphidinium_carterae.1
MSALKVSFFREDFDGVLPMPCNSLSRMVKTEASDALEGGMKPLHSTFGVFWDFLLVQKLL